MKNIKTFMIEIYSDNFNVDTLIYMNEEEFLEAERKSTEEKEDVKDIILKNYITEKIVLKDEIVYIKDYSCTNRNRYLLLNISNFSSIYVDIVGPVGGVIETSKEFLSKF